MPNSDDLVAQLVISVKLLQAHEQVLLQWPVNKVPQDDAYLDIILEWARTAAVILVHQPVVGLEPSDYVLPKIKLEQSNQVTNIPCG